MGKRGAVKSMSYDLQALHLALLVASLTPSKFANAQLVDLTVLNDAVAKGAVCLDGSPPAYNFDEGFGSGANNWLVNVEGGAWCADLKSCADRAKTNLGSSLYMGNQFAFDGILNRDQPQNPDFYNWNRVFVRYCDGSSFTGDIEETSGNLYFRGQRIWDAVMQDLLAKGMNNAEQALLTGCSAGASTVFLHCDRFRELLPKSSTVKCMADAGFFLDVEGNGRPMFNSIVKLHGSTKNFPSMCSSLPDPSQCFYPQYILQSISTSLFILNAAYDSIQVRNVLTTVKGANDKGVQQCLQNIANCGPEEMKILQGFRDEMVNELTPAEESTTTGLFINSCYTHCQAQNQRYWLTSSSSSWDSKTIQKAVGDWYFDREIVKVVDCPMYSEVLLQTIAKAVGDWYFDREIVKAVDCPMSIPL